MFLAPAYFFSLLSCACLSYPHKYFMCFLLCGRLITAGIGEIFNLSYTLSNKTIKIHRKELKFVYVCMDHIFSLLLKKKKYKLLLLKLQRTYFCPVNCYTNISIKCLITSARSLDWIMCAFSSMITMNSSHRYVRIARWESNYQKTVSIFSLQH